MNLKDIAEKAGVSTATVSNVINGNYNKVSDKTREKIETIIKKNNYQPSAMAKALASREKESRLIGVVVPYVNEEVGFAANPYTSSMLSYIEMYLRAQGYYMLVNCVRDCSEIVSHLSKWDVDGAMMLGVSSDDVQHIVDNLDVPTVFIDTYTDVPIANVGIDDYRGSYLATRYLIGKGHRKIAFAGTEIISYGVVSERYRGFKDACSEAGIETSDEDFFETDIYYPHGIIAGQNIALSNRGYTAVCTMSDMIAHALTEGLRQCSVFCPGDISVVGFDGLLVSGGFNPPLTTVSQNLERKATVAGDYLFEMINSKEKLTGNRNIDIELIERQSVNNIW